MVGWINLKRTIFDHYPKSVVANPNGTELNLPKLDSSKFKHNGTELISDYLDNWQ